jgi:lincosamide nucleotidyltransferase A/C/D/E
MTAADIIDLYSEFQQRGITVWIDGGWGVDALLGHQTRHHADLDLAVDHEHVPELKKILKARGYKEIRRASEWNFVFSDASGQEVDIHAFVYDDKGNIVDGILYPALSLTGRGAIAEHSVNCISAEHLIKFHTGYTLRPSDYEDVTALCRKFGIELPDEYSHLKNNASEK